MTVCGGKPSRAWWWRSQRWILECDYAGLGAKISFWIVSDCIGVIITVSHIIWCGSNPFQKIVSDESQDQRSHSDRSFKGDSNLDIHYFQCSRCHLYHLGWQWMMYRLCLCLRLMHLLQRWHQWLQSRKVHLWYPHRLIVHHQTLGLRVTPMMPHPLQKGRVRVPMGLEKPAKVLRLKSSFLMTRMAKKYLRSHWAIGCVCGNMGPPMMRRLGSNGHWRWMTPIPNMPRLTTMGMATLHGKKDGIQHVASLLNVVRNGGPLTTAAITMMMMIQLGTMIGIQFLLQTAASAVWRRHRFWIQWPRLHCYMSCLECFSCNYKWPSYDIN